MNHTLTIVRDAISPFLDGCDLAIFRLLTGERLGPYETLEICVMLDAPWLYIAKRSEFVSRFRNLSKRNVVKYLWERSVKLEHPHFSNVMQKCLNGVELYEVANKFPTDYPEVEKYWGWNRVLQSIIRNKCFPYIFETVRRRSISEFRIEFNKWGSTDHIKINDFLIRTCGVKTWLQLRTDDIDPTELILTEIKHQLTKPLSYSIVIELIESTNNPAYISLELQIVDNIHITDWKIREIKNFGNILQIPPYILYKMARKTNGTPNFELARGLH
jgi:hypothetical protein